MVLSEFRSDGRRLTLRQLYYQLVARGEIENNQRSYKRLGRIVSRGRRAGLLDWSMIVDRNRPLRQRQRWESPEEILREAAQTYHIDLWTKQAFRPEVWIEKDALVDVIRPTCRRWDVPYQSCRGFVSDSTLWRASERYQQIAQGEKCERERPPDAWDDAGCWQMPVMLFLSDHDPSGIGMKADLERRLELLGAPIPIRRIALTKRQIRREEPPPNFAKASDSRHADYVRDHGRKCWELDALPPQMIENLVDREIQRYVTDPEAMKRKKKRRKRDKGKIEEAVRRFNEDGEAT
jgi:hypothetical protein